MALAGGIRRRVGSALGVGVTGIAGPGGGSEEKPVGTVHVAVAHSGGVKERGVTLPGDRDSIRWQASQLALDMVRMHFLYNGGESPTSFNRAGTQENKILETDWYRGVSMRLFVALEIPETVRENLAAIQQKLRVSGADLRLVRPENFHVTLKFIGEAASEKVSGIAEELRGVRTDGAVSANFRGLGNSWHAKRGGVVWVTMEVSDGLKVLAREINRRVEAVGFAAEQRDFLPHLTLARFKRNSALPTVRETVQEYSGQEFGAMHPGDFHLIESKLGPGGSKYTILESFQFAQTANA